MYCKAKNPNEAPKEFCVCCCCCFVVVVAAAAVVVVVAVVVAAVVVAAVAAGAAVFRQRGRVCLDHADMFQPRVSDHSPSRNR